MANKLNQPPGPFAPYDTTINQDDPFMRRVPVKRMDIGANNASMPNGMGEGPGDIEHVGSSAGRNRQG
jgi:hypothetical protein